MLTVDQLEQQHELYAAHATQWEYYYRSYQGGHAYRAGKYLRAYLGESQSPGDQYSLRLQNTPLDNHVKSTVDVYRSFLFATPPVRVLGSLSDNPFAQDFIADADLTGQGMNSFIKTATDLAMVMGQVWVGVDKPAVQVETTAQELELNIRAYTVMYSPQSVLDWHYELDITGRRRLVMLKIREHVSGNQVSMRVWYPDRVEHYTAELLGTGEITKILTAEVFPNALGYIPFVCFQLEPGLTPDVGNSILADIHDVQRSIYNKLSELEQGIRLSLAPSLVKTAETRAAGGAGAIITIPEDLPGDLRPYLLQANGTSISSILDSINSDVASINRMTHLTAVRATATQSASGVAMQVERQLLNSKLSDIADTVQELEQRIWSFWLDWQGIQAPADFSIDYNHSFDLRDTQNDLNMLTQAKQAVNNALFQQYLDAEIVKMFVQDEQALQTILVNLQSAPSALPPLTDQA